MISYEPLWETMRKKNITTYNLIHKMDISNSTIYRIKNGNNINTQTLNDLCNKLDCAVEDILVHIKD